MASCQHDFFSWIFLWVFFFAFTTFAVHHVKSAMHNAFDRLNKIILMLSACSGHHIVDILLLCCFLQWHWVALFPYTSASIHIHMHWPLKNKTFKHSSRKLQWIINIMRWIWTAKKWYWSPWIILIVVAFCCVCCVVSAMLNCKWMRSHWVEYKCHCSTLDNSIKRNHCRCDSSHSNRLTEFKKMNQASHLG